MKHISKDDISKMEKIERLNLINSCTGYKSANLIVTKSNSGIANIAIFSSITHLGSNPAMIGFIMRPTSVPRGTYKNIKETGFFTVNHVTSNIIADAHHTSASYDSDISEFSKTYLEEEYKNNLEIPFLKDAPVQLYCKYLNEYHIKENGTIHVIASIEHLFFNENLHVIPCVSVEHSCKFWRFGDIFRPKVCKNQDGYFDRCSAHSPAD